MAHLAAGHHVPVQVKDVLKRRAGVRRQAEAADASVARDPGRRKYESTCEVRVRELGDRDDMATRDDENVEWCCARLRVERDDVGVLEADRRGSFVSGDPAEDAVTPRGDSRS